MWNSLSRFRIVTALLIYAMLALVGCAASVDRPAATKTFQVPKKDGSGFMTKTGALMTDLSGNKIACASDTDCASLMGEDVNFGGALCDRFASGGGACYAVVKNCSQVTDVTTGLTSFKCSYPDADNCVASDACNDDNDCTVDACVYGMFKDSDVPTGICNRPAIDPSKGPKVTCGKGTCAASVNACSSLGVLDPNPVCTELPVSATEICDNKDNDCDGTTDEDFASMGLGDACLVGVGECSNNGQKQCKADGSGLECSVSPKASGPETCDTKDNDCDGSTDEDFVLGADCTNGLGVCAKTGKTVCKADKSAAVCDAVAGASGTESCNDQDDNCDGTTDDGCDDDTDGYCDKNMAVSGTPKACSKGAGDCNDGEKLVYPNQSEVCNSADDNCDGVTDEAFSGLGQSCVSGQGECAAGGQKVCGGNMMSVICNGNAGAPQTEICDNKDNDCDGVTDDGCDDDGDGYCDSTMTIASGPTPTVCTDGVNDCDDQSAFVHPVQTEACNGSDDNCNGSTDEGLTGNTTCGYASCQVTVAKCVNGVQPVCSPDLSKAQSEDLFGVDGKDNDCNGVVDDGSAAAWCNNPVAFNAGAPDKQLVFTGANSKDLVDSWSCPDANGKAVTLPWVSTENLYKVSSTKGKTVTCKLTETSGAGTLTRGLMRLAPANVCDAAPKCLAFGYNVLTWTSDGTDTWLAFDGKDKASPYAGTLKCTEL